MLKVSVAIFWVERLKNNIYWFPYLVFKQLSCCKTLIFNQNIKFLIEIMATYRFVLFHLVSVFFVIDELFTSAVYLMI